MICANPECEAHYHTYCYEQIKQAGRDKCAACQTWFSENEPQPLGELSVPRREDQWGTLNNRRKRRQRDDEDELEDEDEEEQELESEDEVEVSVFLLLIAKLCHSHLPNELTKPAPVAVAITVPLPVAVAARDYCSRIDPGRERAATLPSAALASSRPVGMSHHDKTS